jgi:hypothetical protein
LHEKAALHLVKQVFINKAPEIATGLTFKAFDRINPATIITLKYRRFYAASA